MKIPKGQSESVNRRRTDTTMAKRKKHKRTNNDLKNSTQKTKDLATRIPPKTGDLMCLGRLCSSFSTSDTCCVTLITKPEQIRGHLCHLKKLIDNLSISSPNLWESKTNFFCIEINKRTIRIHYKHVLSAMTHARHMGAVGRSIVKSTKLENDN